MTTPTEFQIAAIDSLIDKSQTVADIPKRTLAVLERENWVKDGIVTQAGLEHTTYPTIPVNVAVFGREVTYTHQFYPEGTSKADIASGRVKVKRETYRFPKGTELLITFVHRAKKQQVYEGMINVQGEAMWVRIYRQSHMKLERRIMPDKRGIENVRR